MKKCSDYIENINLFIDEELEEEKIPELLSHIESCPECAALLNEYKNIKVELKYLEADAPLSLHDRIMADIKSGDATKDNSANFFKFRPFTLIAAAAAIFVLAAGGAFGNLNLFTQPIKSDSKTLYKSDSTYSGKEETTKQNIMADKIENGENGTDSEGLNAAAPVKPKASLKQDETKISEGTADPEANNASKEQDKGDGAAPGNEGGTEPKDRAMIKMAAPENSDNSAGNGESQIDLEVPNLPYSRSFAFYIVAKGDADIPDYFKQFEIVETDDKTQVHIFADSSEQVKNESLNALSEAAFVTNLVESGLPSIDPNADKGLIIILK